MDGRAEATNDGKAEMKKKMKTSKSITRRVDKKMRRRKRVLGSKGKRRNITKHRAKKKRLLDSSMHKIVRRITPGM